MEDEIYNGDLEADLKEDSAYSIHPLNSLPAMEAVLSIQKIRTQIFSLLNLEDLRNCRLVSHEWKLFATNETLLKWEANEIIIQREMNSSELTVCSLLQKEYQPMKSLVEFTNLLKITGENPFPCHRFRIQYINLNEDYPDLQDFLNNQGYRMKHLSLVLFYGKIFSKVGPSNREFKWEKMEGPLIKFLTLLIQEQAPNLETIFIELQARIDKDRLKICEYNVKGSNSNSMEINTESLDLKCPTIRFHYEVQKSVFKCICDLAPKLKGIQMGFGFGKFCLNNPALMGKNRHFYFEKLNNGKYAIVTARQL